MYTASSILVKARTYFISKANRDNKSKIFVKKKGKLNYYLGDRAFYRKEYLKSDHWKHLRKRKLELNPICERCYCNIFIEPHHIVYKNLYDVKLSDLQSLCRRCHTLIHKRKRYLKRINFKMRHRIIKKINMAEYYKHCEYEQVKY